MLPRRNGLGWRFKWNTLFPNIENGLKINEVKRMNNPYMRPDNKLDTDSKKVVIVDVQIPFSSLVNLIVKIALAGIPAFIILFLLMVGLLSWLRLLVGH